MKGLASLLFASCALAAKQPNILFILTDDQDSYMNSIDYMPLVQVSLTRMDNLSV